MSKHDDDSPVMVGYSSSRNHTFRSSSPEELGYSWGDWRSMTKNDRQDALMEYVSGLVDVWVEDDDLDD